MSYLTRRLMRCDVDGMMNTKRLWLVILFVVQIPEHGSGATCSRAESLILLSLQSIIPSLPWTGWDCCKFWPGVTCDDFTGAVLELDLSKCSLFYVPKSLEGLNNLKVLRVRGNLIKKVPTFLLRMPSLQTLDFSGNLIQKFESSCFDVSNLTELLLGDNFITSFRPCARDLQNLEKLILSDNDILEIPESSIMGGFPQLSMLDLDNNYLGQLPTAIGNLSNLLSLNADSNQLTNIPQSFSHLSSLEDLILSSNLLIEIPSLLTKLPSLELLDISSNKIVTVPRSIGELASLQILILSNNYVTDFPDTSGNLSSLLTLQLDNNALTVFPDSLAQLLNLATLYIDYNQIRVIPQSLCALSSLKEIVISDNSVQELPECVGELTSINYLDADDNLIEHIPHSLGMLSDLFLLSMEGNNIEELPDIFGNLSSLSRLYLPNNKIRHLPSSVGNLTSLESLSLNNNLFSEFPAMITTLANLTSVDLSMNFLRELDSSISRMNVKSLNLSYNNLTGHVPSSWSNLTSLLQLQLIDNHFSGSLIDEICQILPQLTDLHAGMNTIATTIPEAIKNMTQLVTLMLTATELTGSVPAHLFNMSKLCNILLSQNQLTGSLPGYIECSPNPDPLFHLLVDLSQNQITGLLPEFATNCRLSYLTLNGNRITGNIPPSFANQTELVVLDVSHNLLTGTIPSFDERATLLELINLAHNHLSGSLPVSITMCRALSRLRVESNMLTGEIPQELSNLKHSLITLSLADNYITGAIPAILGTMDRLVILDLGRNRLSGMLSSSLRDLGGSLRVLLIGHNELHGRFPEWIVDLHALQLLDLSHNLFEGELVLPRSLAGLKGMSSASTLTKTAAPTLYSDSITIHVKNGELEVAYLMAYRTSVDISNNNFNGSIPAQIGDLTGLIAFNISNNKFTGTIPSSLGNLKSIESLDLSMNLLTSRIPASFLSLNFLSVLNVSYNQLSGDIVDTRFDSSTYYGNVGLCGFPLIECARLVEAPSSSNPIHLSGEEPRSDSDFKWIWITAPSGAVLILAGVGISFLLISSCCTNKKRVQQAEDTKYVTVADLQMKQDLQHGTDGFNEANIIGRGSNSIVYKGTLANGEVIAVKTMAFNDEGATAQLFREMETLQTLRHRNLLKMHGICWSLNALILEYMPNGSLYDQLHGSDTIMLSWKTRLNIAVGVADALVYLHHDCLKPVLHCDLKPSNILLDSNFVPKVGDFGISKTMSGMASESSNFGSSLAGTTGYIAPEYGMSSRLSTRGDVYSYGVTLLELLTRQHPTCSKLEVGESLISWTKNAFPDRICQVLDFELVKEARRDEMQQILLAVKLALLCTSNYPKLRPSMRDVAAMLRQISHGGPDEAEGSSQQISHVPEE